MQKRLHGMGWSDEKTSQGYGEKGGTETHRQYNCPAWREARDQVPEELGRRKEELVVGQWCSLIMMARWVRCMEFFAP